MATITDITSWFQKNSSWIKIVAILLLIGFLILSVTNAGCVRKQRDKFIEQTTILHLLNDSINAQNKKLNDSLLKRSADRIELVKNDSILKLKNDFLIVLSNNQRKKISQISTDIAKLTSDSIYKFLTSVAYPDTGKLTYPFSKDQIRHIDETYFQKIAFTDLVNILDKVIINSSLRLSTMDSLVTSYRESTIILNTENHNLNETISNKNKEIDLYKKQERQANANSTIWKISTGVATVIALILVFK